MWSANDSIPGIPGDPGRRPQSPTRWRYAAYELIDDARRPEVAPGEDDRAWKVRNLMAAKYIFVVLGTGFLLAGVSERLRGRRNPASRTWLIIGTIFTLVGLFLFAQS